MKVSNTVIACAIALATPQALLAGSEKPSASVAVSSVTAASSKDGLVSGLRGTAIPVTGDQLLFLKKGDQVDLLVTFDAVMGNKTKEMLTATIIQNVPVINVHRPERTEETGALELLLNPAEAQYAALSVAQGKKINVVVRSPGDTELHKMEIASFRRLIR